MATQRLLADLNITNKQLALSQIPDFDFVNLSRVIELQMRWNYGDADSPRMTCDMIAEYRPEHSANAWRVAIRFDGVRQLRLDEMHHHGYFLTELEIKDVSMDQLEGIRFNVADYCMSAFLLRCESIAIVSCDPL